MTSRYYDAPPPPTLCADQKCNGRLGGPIFDEDPKCLTNQLVRLGQSRPAPRYQCQTCKGWVYTCACDACWPNRVATPPPESAKARPGRETKP